MLEKYQCFGPTLKAHIGYMRFRQNVTWDGILKWFEEMVGEKISAGTLQNIFNEIKSSLESEYFKIKEDIRNSDIVGADETGFKLNGEKWWIHVYRTEKETLFTHSKSRGHKVKSRQRNVIPTERNVITRPVTVGFF